MRSSFILGAALAVVPSWGQTLTAEMIEKMGNNSLFERWRPTSHFLAPAGWMNDPCAPMYDPVRGIYHLHYQYHPNHISWGNVSWGHATSRDLITWTDVDHHPDNDLPAWKDSEAQSIGTSNSTGSGKHNPALFNHLAIFSGGGQPVNLSGQIDGTLLLFYTGASSLPTAWNTPYARGTESQALAFSTDGGVTWKDYEKNPILSDPPGNWNVTGWRDPYFISWSELDDLTNASQPHFYAVFGSGIRGIGPRMPLYRAPASNLTDWTFMGALWEPEKNTSLGLIEETGSYGFNFELSNFFSLENRYFVSMGAEGGNNKWSLWNEGTISVRSNGSIAFEPISGGASDWGLLYAIASFNDTKNNRRLQWGWAQEDLDDFGTVQQGYQGAYALPREIFIQNTSNVIHHSSSSETPGNARFFKNAHGSWTASTLGLQTSPAPNEVVKLRLSISPKSLSNSYQIALRIEKTNGLAGISVATSPNQEEYTNIFFDPRNNTLGVDRSHSSLIKNFTHYTHAGYFKPYEIATNTTAGSKTRSTTESIDLTIFVDGSLIEVYANDRFALTSRIYPSREDSTGILFFKEDGVEVEYSRFEIWDGLLNVWPDRPKNSSSMLVFDTPAETGNYTWWTGN
ncbi:uncharacterized protein N7469_000067 [Penicillium citrinum]|uniref:Glycoside hydrolase family 32 protein n=1 Tax=Penicillium citrinum TaxID=5077 RepID=A0A9W9PC59_PENCI|nr:uncharacterized protein N7469_000067 [Penicillium citrinum]KAJ5241740.1 hypothetical protein N7469_000067 [Penicillium citrinum]